MKERRKRKRKSGFLRSFLRVLFLGAAVFIILAGQHGIRFPWSSELWFPDFPGTVQSVSVARLDDFSAASCIVNPELIPGYDGKVAAELNGNVPNFTDYDLENISGEKYSDLDGLGRCGAACAMLDRSMMPEEKRQTVGTLRPSGWHSVKYPDVIEDGFLYNRCHLIAYAMTGSEADSRNLITGTRYMNTEGMLPFEVEVLRYLDDSDNHVMYRVTPFFRGNDLVATGVEMEAYSVEDRGRGVCFHVFVYNVQPGIVIDYSSGASRKE